MGVTRDGRVAAVTNVAEAGDQGKHAVGVQSRGQVVRDVLCPMPGSPAVVRPCVDELKKRLGGDFEDAGGFNLVYGHEGRRIVVCSNRSDAAMDLSWGGTPGHTWAVSNGRLGARAWDKVVLAERAVDVALADSVRATEPEPELVERMLRVLSLDTLPRDQGFGTGVEGLIAQLQKSIFIPVLKMWFSADPPGSFHAELCGLDSRDVEETPSTAFSGKYGTTKQTVLLFHRSGRVKFIERTLFDGDDRPLDVANGRTDQIFEFQLREH